MIKAYLNLRRIGLWIFGAMLLAANAHAASFSCRKAAQPAEQAICASAELSRLDDRLAQVWQENGRGAEIMQQPQRDWLQQRNACGKDLQCLRTSYLLRIKQLSDPDFDRINLNGFAWIQTWTFYPLKSDKYRGAKISFSPDPTNGARIHFYAASWIGVNRGREYQGVAVVRADGKAFHVSSTGCELNFELRGTTMLVKQLGSCGTVIGDGAPTTFQGVYVDEDHSPDKMFEFE
jgi:uncharacterized protein